MSKVRVKFPNPRIVALGILRGEFPSAHFGTILPDARLADDQGLPYVRVSVDGRSGQYPVTAEAAVRVQVWTATEKEGEDLAEEMKAVLLAFPGSAEVRNFAEGVGPLPTTDPDTGNPLSYFTATVRLRPIPF